MAKRRYPSEEADRFIVRFPPGMRDQIRAAAESNNRSMNSEIIERLERTFFYDARTEEAINSNPVTDIIEAHIDYVKAQDEMTMAREEAHRRAIEELDSKIDGIAKILRDQIDVTKNRVDD